MPRKREQRRSVCPVACTLDLLGDKWTLLIVRDLLFFDRHRFSEFLAAGEGISTNILAERLARLERAGVVERRHLQEQSSRAEYHLTEKGRDLGRVLKELVRWGSRHVPGCHQPPAGFLDASPSEPLPRNPRRPPPR